MDTTYVTIMLIVFLVLTGLAVDVGYLYVSEEDLQGAAESAALAGTGAIKQRILFQVQNDPKKISEVFSDPVQSAARVAAVEAVSGKHSSVALVGLSSNNANALTGDNDLTVGFWNVSSQSYTPGGTPANAMQVRTRRTAESSSVGMGALGSFMARITGTSNFDFTPVAIAAIPARTRASIALCSASCDPACSYPEVCSVKERRMSLASPDQGQAPAAGDRYLFTSLLHPVTVTNTMSDLICGEGQGQEVCGKPIYTSGAANGELLREIQSMMYNPKFDRSNKEYDKSGRLLGWWVIVPVTECGQLTPESALEPHAVTKYSLVRISRICAGATGAGCPQTGGQQDAPAATCGPADGGLYLDRISCVGCGSKSLLLLPGLQPVLVK